MNKELEKLALIQKVFEKLAEWNAYDLARLDEDYETNFDLDFLEIEQALKEHEQHKVVEEALGIDLETYFKALNNGAWYKDTSGNICWCDMPKFSKGDIDFNGYHTTTRMYGVIWALTKEELL